MVARKFPDSPLLRALDALLCPSLLLYTDGAHDPLLRLLACEKRCKQW